ncbi:hypothetical protein DFR57_12129 [Saliterribacillus persicus]|uniref:Uncharacterized protein n=1 Tax=Saliterribacillus persicus TaxID=930114 RepID=A0A368X4P6_9BACI|nr:hypothetical protein DFR57_12129 [Saliterribacillus persicus]
MYLFFMIISILGLLLCAIFSLVFSYKLLRQPPTVFSVFTLIILLFILITTFNTFFNAL